MKFLMKTALSLLFFFSSIFSQNSSLSQAVEIFIGTENVIPTSEKIEFYLTACGAVWGGERISSTENNYYLTTEFNNSTYLVLINNNDQGGWGGWDFVLSRTFNPPSFPIYGWGLYKFTTDESNSFFYLDYRDDRYGNYVQYEPTSFGHDADIWIKYNASTDKFFLKSAGIIDWLAIEPIQNGQLVTIWSIKQKGVPTTNKFPGFWQNSLVITQTSNNNPRLVWGPHPTFSTTNYKVYRAVSATPVSKPLILDFSLIYTTSSANTFEYTDIDLQLGNIDYIYYYVKAYNNTNDTYSSSSNIAATRAGFYKKNSESSDNAISSNTFFLSTNYPNPFNPSTTINYQLPTSSFVTLKVYDILGNEIATLVNEEKAAGTYQVKFTAQQTTNNKQLASGMYFYTLTAGKFTDTKKFILLK